MIAVDQDLGFDDRHDACSGRWRRKRKGLRVGFNANRLGSVSETL